MVKNILIGIMFVLALIAVPYQVQAARTDEGMWTQISTYIKTVCTGGCDVLINGANKYLNFGSVSGTSGYGIRDNAGVIECKDSGGSWSPCQDGGGAGGSAHNIQDEGISLTDRANLNFVGSGVAVTDDAGNNASVVTIAGQTPWTQNINGSTYSISGVGSLDATSSVITQATSTNIYTPNLKVGTLSGVLKAISGTVQTATAGTDYENPLTVTSPITRTLNALGFDFSTQNTWTGHNIFSSLFATNASSTNATSTNLGVTNIYALSSSGIDIHSSNGTHIAELGQGGGSNATFSGGVNIDGATRLATSLTGLLQAYSGSVSAVATSSLNLLVGSFLSPNVSQWTNDAGYLSTVDISANTNLTAGDALTLTNDDIDFDGGATPSGDLGGTWASPSVTDDSHAHTGTTLSGIDISSDTNLSGDTEVVLTGDALSLGAGVTRDTELVGLGSKWATSGSAIIPNVSGTGVMSTGSSTFQWLNSASSSITLLSLPSVLNALTLTNGNGNVSAYTGTTCTNQFVRSLSAIGVATCATVQTTDVASGIALDSELPVGANPTASVGLSAVNGVATTFMRSDGAPALSQSIIPTWTGLHTFNTSGLIATASSTIQNLFSTNASTTNLIVSSAGAGTGCAQFSTGGTLTNTGTACGTGGGGGDSKFSTSSAVTTSIYANVATRLGLGTTSPWAKLSIFGREEDTNPRWPLFLVGTSSRQSGSHATTTAFMVDYNGRVGTGTSSPWTDFAITGTTSITNGLIVGGAGSSTFTNGITIESGCFSVLGTCIGSGGTLTGSGVANRNGFWTSANNLSYSDENVWDNTNKRMGVGTSSPFAKLSVASANAVTGIPLFAVGTSSLSVSTSTAFFIASNSNTVIGSATTTDSVLTVSTSTAYIHGLNDVLARFVGASGAPARMELVSSAGNTNGSFINFVRTNGSLTSPTAVTDGMVLGAVGAGGYGASQLNSNIALWAMKAVGTFTNTSAPTKQEWYTTPNNSLTALLRMTLTASGTLAIGTTTSQHSLRVKGRIHAQPQFDCPVLINTVTAVVADQLGSATLAPTLCNGNMGWDMMGTTDGRIPAMTASIDNYIASGTPPLQSLDLGYTSPNNGNEGGYFKSQSYIGSATSSNGIAQELWIRTPNVGTPTTSLTYFAGFANITFPSLTTTASVVNANEGCYLVASSTATWKAYCRRAGVTSTIYDTGFATSTTAFKALMTLDQNGFNVYINDRETPNATVPSANIPMSYLRAVGGALTTSGISTTIGVGGMQVGQITVWSPDW